MDNYKKNIGRREFLRIVGIATAASSINILQGCTPGPKKKLKTAVDDADSRPAKMTYRNFSDQEKESVSILGYGCMRWPTTPSPDGKGDLIDQEKVNQLVDYAMKHGVNYYDTSPVYVQGWSEKATGIALKRYPRERFKIATKLSNFSNYTRENSIKMYKQSFVDLQVEYIDYYLLHSIGNGGIRTFNARYIENGMLDYLIKEREAGRIRHLGFSFHGTKDVFDEVLAMHEQVHWDFVQIQLNYLDWNHASGNNVNADYLYEELQKKHIPAIIMEPLLGGRLSKLPDHIVARLKQRQPENSVASWAFRFAGSPANVLTVLSGMTYMEHLQDNLRTYSPLVPLTEDERQFLFDTANLITQYPPYRVMIANIACHVPMVLIFLLYYCIIINALMKAILQEASRMKIITRLVVLSLSDMTEVYLVYVKQTTALDVNSVTRIAHSLSIYLIKCNESMIL